MVQKWYNIMMWTAMLSFVGAFVIMFPLWKIFNYPPHGIMDWISVAMVGGGGFTILLGFFIGGFTGHFRRLANGGDNFRRDVRYVLDKKEEDDDSN